MKPLFNKNELKAKGLKRVNKIHVPDHLDKVKTAKKPEITLNLSDRFNQLRIWFSEKLVNYGVSVVGKLIPWWFWIILAIGIILLIRLAL